MNIIDKAVEYLSPEAALRRDTARKVLAAQRAYEAAQHSRLRKIKTDAGSGDAITERAGESLRLQARHLDENHDLAGGVLDCLVNNVVGRGIFVEPQVKTPDGDLAKEVNDRLMELWTDWVRFPDVTWENHWGQMLRLVARHWFRDGEVLLKHVQGIRRDLSHGTMVLKHAIRRHEAQQIIHLKIAKRISQTRGVSIFANVLTRLEDVKDYELSERMTAKVAASMCAYIRKSLDGPLNNVGTDADGNRTMKMQPGLIFDNLLPGEDVGMIDANRPNSMLEQFRNGQLRAIAAGTSTSFSSISKDYRGTYSSQRQELVEQSVHYAVLREYFIERCVRPIWERFVAMAVLAGQLDDVGASAIAANSIINAGFQGPVTPWIDPQKEANAEEKMVQSGFKVCAQVIRERGNNPQAVFEQIKQEREQDAESGLSFSTTVSTDDSQNELEGEEDAEEDES